MYVNEYVASHLVRMKNEELKRQSPIQRAVAEYINEYKANRKNNKRQ